MQPLAPSQDRRLHHASRQHIASALLCPSALSSELSYPAPSVSTLTTPDCLAGLSPAGLQRLPPLQPCGFYSGHSPRLQELKHFADQAKHRKPIRPLKPFLRYPCSSSRRSRHYPVLPGGTGAVRQVLPNRAPFASGILASLNDAIVLDDFGGPNGEAPPYPSAQVVRSSASSPSRLTDKPFALSNGPFMVELFTVGRFAPDRRTSHVRFGLSPGSKLPTSARLYEVARNDSEPPWTGLRAPYRCASPALKHDGLRLQRNLGHVRIAPIRNNRYRIECRYYSARATRLPGVR